MNTAKRAQKKAIKAAHRKQARKGRELYILRARDLKGKPRLYPIKGVA